MAYLDPFHLSGDDHLDKRAGGHYHVESRCQFGQRVKLRAYDDGAVAHHSLGRSAS